MRSKRVHDLDKERERIKMNHTRPLILGSVFGWACLLATGCFDTSVQPCEVIENEDGSVTVDCGDEGGRATVQPGADGADGEAGQDGADGAPGSAGENGPIRSVVESTQVEPGEDCPAGGIAITIVIDSNGDGSIDQQERDLAQGATVCHPPCPRGYSIEVGETPDSARCVENSSCQVDDDCSGGMTCSANVCVESCMPGFALKDGTCRQATPSEVSVGEDHACARYSDQGVRCWGRNNAGQIRDTPAGLKMQDIDAGHGFSCGLLMSGVASCWGSTLDGMPGPNVLREIETGLGYACALDDSGSVLCWGTNLAGQLDGVPGTRGYTRLDVGVTAACALDAQGALTCWGDDQSGLVTNAPTGSGFVDVSVGTEHACAIDAQGTLECWGQDPGAELGSAPSGSDFVAVGAGRSYTCALKSSGDLECWGLDAGGRVSGAPTSGVKTLSIGEANGCVITTTDTITCWGDDTHGLVSDAP